MKVVWNTCDKEFGGEMKSFYKKTTSKVHLKTYKSHFLLEKFMQNIKRKTVYGYSL